MSGKFSEDLRRKGSFNLERYTLEVFQGIVLRWIVRVLYAINTIQFVVINCTIVVKFSL